MFMFSKMYFWLMSALISLRERFESLPPSTALRSSGSESSESESMVTLDYRIGVKILSVILSVKLAF